MWIVALVLGGCTHEVTIELPDRPGGWAVWIQDDADRRRQCDAMDSFRASTAPDRVWPKVQDYATDSVRTGADQTVTVRLKRQRYFIAASTEPPRTWGAPSAESEVYFAALTDADRVVLAQVYTPPLCGADAW